jgi:hypothetical protein
MHLSHIYQQIARIFSPFSSKLQGSFYVDYKLKNTTGKFTSLLKDHDSRAG